jgi:hypothetical protein
MAFIAERLSLEKLKSVKELKPLETLKSLEKLNLPPSPARDLLAYLHSGDVLRHGLPRLLRIGALVWLFVYVLLWIAVWPAIYEAFERWGLVKAFFAQMILIVTAFLVARITLLRARHLQVLPPDDFVNLRALAILYRWFGEIALVYVVGRGLSSLLQPVSAPMNSVLSGLSPGMAGAVSSGTPKLLLLSAPLSFFFVAVAASLFLGLYAAATAIDVYLAIEFNTRTERAGKGVA